MIIQKQPVLSWLLEENPDIDEEKLVLPLVDNPVHVEYLYLGLRKLDVLRAEGCCWGLPQLIMPSFKRVMKKSAPAFYSMDHSLFTEFCSHCESGILLPNGNQLVLVYRFQEERLHIWLFINRSGESQLINYFYVESTMDNRRIIYSNPTLAQNKQLFVPNEGENGNGIYEILTNMLMIFLAVKKYVRVESVVIPQGKTVKLEAVIPEYKGKEKIQNIGGQEVIVMDSRWFRKIVNDNDIFVRGFFRFQNKKDENGEWYKELIFVDAFVRHGYHRNAKIEEKREQ